MEAPRDIITYGGCPGCQESSTSIGIDVGEQALLTACAIENGTPVKPKIVDGAKAKRIRKVLSTTIRRLQRREAAEWRIEERRQHFQNILTDVIERASRSAIEYAEGFDEPVLVMEDLDGFRDGLNRREFINRRLHSWAFGRIQRRIRDKAIEVGIPVRFVSPTYYSIICHTCGSTGDRPDRGTFECTSESCHITDRPISTQP